MSKKAIQNIPTAKWPNVFNLSAIVAQREQASLGLLEDVILVEDQTTDGGSSDFLSKNGRGSGQTPENGLGNPRNGGLATTNGGSGQPPIAGVGNYPRGVLATTHGGCSPTTHGGCCPLPTGGVANSRVAGLATPACGIPIRLSDGSETVKDTPDEAINRLRNRNRDGKAPQDGKRQKAEEEFLESVGVILGKTELQRNGGLWIKNFRTNPTRANAVIAEVRVMKLEGRIKASAPKAAIDLWKRWK